MVPTPVVNHTKLRINDGRLTIVLEDYSIDVTQSLSGEIENIKKLLRGIDIFEELSHCVT